MKTCKYCGKKYDRSNKVVCSACYHKQELIPRFIKARDELRRLTNWTEKHGGDDND